jgi:hypothetical protein
MPLLPGHDRKTISHNIAELIKAGHTPASAAAAAYRKAGEYRKKANEPRPAADARK